MHIHISKVKKAFLELKKIEEKENYFDEKISFLKKGNILESFKQDSEYFINFLSLSKSFFTLYFIFFKMKKHIVKSNETYYSINPIVKEINYLIESNQPIEAYLLSRSVFNSFSDFLNNHSPVIAESQDKIFAFRKSKAFKILTEKNNVPNFFNIHKHTNNIFVKIDTLLSEESFRTRKYNIYKQTISKTSQQLF
tara:strand:+ start:10728 stop:11312 length:585 start_codon:yes stop_codon:yes gene_type:complete